MNATVSGTFSASDGFVRCITPPVSEVDVPLATMVYVTLNGQQYHSSADALIAQAALDEPASAAYGANSGFGYLGHSRVTSISPTCGRRPVLPILRSAGCISRAALTIDAASMSQAAPPRRSVVSSSMTVATASTRARALTTMARAEIYTA